MSFSKRHHYPRHAIVSFKNPITEMWLPDLHVFFDGRMSERTAWNHMTSSIDDYIARSAQPAVPTHWARLGESDYNTYAVPYIPSENFRWSWHGADIVAFRPYVKYGQPSTYVTVNGKSFGLSIKTDPQLTHDRVKISAFEVPMTGHVPHRVAYRESITIGDGLYFIIEQLKEKTA